MVAAPVSVDGAADVVADAVDVAVVGAEIAEIAAVAVVLHGNRRNLV